MKKLVWLSCWLAFSTGLVCAQTAPATSVLPPVEILKYRWSHFQSGSLGLETGVPNPGAPSRADQRNAQRQLEVLRQHAPEAKEEIAIREDQQRQSQRPQVKVYSPQNPTAETRFKYTLELKNTVEQLITEVSWDYVFLEPGQPREALRHHFVSKVKIKPGAKANVVVYAAAAPYGVVSAKSASDQANECVVIKQIVYANSSVWIAP